MLKGMTRSSCASRATRTAICQRTNDNILNHKASTPLGMREIVGTVGSIMRRPSSDLSEVAAYSLSLPSSRRGAGPGRGPFGRLLRGVVEVFSTSVASGAYSSPVSDAEASASLRSLSAWGLPFFSDIGWPRGGHELSDCRSAWRRRALVPARICEQAPISQPIPIASVHAMGGAESKTIR